MKLYLQHIVELIQLPLDWTVINFMKFSERKILFDYQQDALKNALKALYIFYNSCKGDKQKFLEIYRKNSNFTENFDLDIEKSKRYKIFENFISDYKIENNRISFYHFINRMSFWMATGSGKTLVIVKLLELLGNLIKAEQIRKGDILFLTYREDLIEQFKKHVDEFNKSDNSIRVNLYILKDYEKVKRENRLSFSDEIDVFYYRSDLIGDEQKDKIVDFKNYDNNGNWYVLLDEAHKGDREESKRQLYYSILSRNGFLFNFSATFTDPLDFVTCVFNFNLEKFIKQGYGKHICISQSSVNALNEKEDFTDKQKQVIILKIFLLHSFIKKAKLQVNGFYHYPLTLVLVNSVNTEDSDLYLFFKEVERIANGYSLSEELLVQAKSELKNDLNERYEFELENIGVDLNAIDDISYSDILQFVFNALVNGNIEVLKIPQNKQEIVLKLKTSERPFALIKIGDISEWIKNKLHGYEIIETFDNESIFTKLNNNDSDINILMGSRAFYEGWDSNRPNVVLYINIGKGTDAKKFVLQSIGRGLRIEPLSHKRRRLQFLYSNNEIERSTYETISRQIKPLETLFVYGTKAENLKEVINALREEKQDVLIADLDKIVPNREEEKKLVNENYTAKFEINEKDFELVQNYFNYIGDKVFLVKYGLQPKILKEIVESFCVRNDYYRFDPNIAVIGKPEVIVKNIIKYFYMRDEELKYINKI